jgi:hypothetical protein
MLSRPLRVRRALCVKGWPDLGLIPWPCPGIVRVGIVRVGIVRVGIVRRGGGGCVEHESRQHVW